MTRGGRIPEITPLFASGTATIGENLPGSLLYARRSRAGNGIRKTIPRLSPIKNLVVVHRLREVSCIYGFTRFEAAPSSADGEIEDVRLAVHGAPLSLGADWLPAVEQFGEGLFSHFDEAVIPAWLAREPVFFARGSFLAPTHPALLCLPLSIWGIRTAARHRVRG